MVMLRSVVLVLIAGGCVGLPLFWSLPNPLHERWLGILQNSCHVPLFALLQLVLLKLCLSLPTQRPSRRIRIVASVVITMLVGGAIELIQARIGRSPSWEDWVNDGLGALIGLTLWAGFSWQNHLWLGRLLGVSAAAGLLTLGFWPVLPWLHAKVVSEQMFPILMNAEHRAANKLLRGLSGGTLASILAPPKWRDNQSRVLAVRLPANGRSPGFILENLPANWVGFEALSFKAYSPINKPVKIKMYFYSLQNKARQVATFPAILQPGLNDISLPIKALTPFNPQRVLSVQWRAIDNTTEVTLLFDDIGLVLGQ